MNVIKEETVINKDIEEFASIGKYQSQKFELEKIRKDNDKDKDWLIKYKVYPPLFPFKSKKVTEEGIYAEQKVFYYLKKLAEENHDSYLIHEPGKAIQSWLEKRFGKSWFSKLLEKSKSKINMKVNAFAPDFLLFNKVNGIFLIDSKHVKNIKTARPSYEKAINQSKVFISLLTVLNPDIDKLDFHIGAYMPVKMINNKFNDKKNLFIIDDNDFKLMQFSMINRNFLDTINEDIYENLINFLIGLKIKFDSEMVKNSISVIDNRLKEYVYNEMNKQDSLIGN
jgi:hypothetical protein